MGSGRSLYGKELTEARAQIYVKEQQSQVGADIKWIGDANQSGISQVPVYHCRAHQGLLRGHRAAAWRNHHRCHGTASDRGEGCERVQQRTAEQTEDVPQFAQETGEMATLAPHDRVQQRPHEHIVDESISQITETTFEVVKIVAEERISERICEQVVGAPVPQEEIVEQIADMPVPVPRKRSSRSWTCPFPISGAHFRAHRGAEG